MPPTDNFAFRVGTPFRYNATHVDAVGASPWNRPVGSPFVDRDKLEKVQRLSETMGCYQREAYVFTLEALNFTIEKLNHQGEFGHIDGKQLCEGICDYASRSFGYLTKTVFAHWGVTRTEDFGEIVFALVEEGLLSKQETDSPADFVEAFKFEDVFEKKLIYD